MNPTIGKPPTIGKAAIGTALKNAGLGAGDVVLIHSAMRTMGRVEKGPETVVEALLETVGPDGTIVAPTFTFRKEVEADPVIDPRTDPSEMGAISEAVRRHPAARRSVAFRHSVAAIGRRARVITETDPHLSPFDLRSSFGVMLALNAQILLLGVPYSNATAFHVCEWLQEVPYRRAVERRAKLRGPDGSVEEFAFTDYQPKPNADGSYYGNRTRDFNRVGSILEAAGEVAITTVGNALARRFSLRSLCDYAQRELARDTNLFRTEDDQANRITPLKDGQIVLADLTDGAGRTSRHQWSVIDPQRLAIPPRISCSLLTRQDTRAPR